MFQKDLEGPELVEEEKRPERPSTAIDEQYIKKQVLANRQISIKGLSYDSGISLWRINSIFGKTTHDNAPSHNALILRNDFVKNSPDIILKSLHSPDLVSWIFWLFNKLKRSPQGHRFESI